MVQLSKYFVWFVSLFAVATSLIACSDDADEGTLLPEMVGDWDIVDSYEAIYIDGKETTTNRDPWNGNTYKFHDDGTYAECDNWGCTEGTWSVRDGQLVLTIPDEDLTLYCRMTSRSDGSYLIIRRAYNLSVGPKRKEINSLKGERQGPPSVLLTRWQAYRTVCCTVRTPCPPRLPQAS